MLMEIAIPTVVVISIIVFLVTHLYSKRPVKSETRQYSKSDDVMLYGRIMLPDQEYVKQAINYEESDEWGEASLAWSKASRHFSITNPELAKVAELYRLRVNLIDAEREKPEEAMRILKNIKNTLDDIGIELPEHDIVIQKEQVFIESEIAEVKTETGWGKPINNYLPLVTLDMTERDQLSGKEGTGEIPVRIGLFGENGSEISSCAGFATFQYTAYEGQRKCCVNDCLIETLRATVGNKLRISYLNTQDRELNYYDQIFLTFRSKIIQAKRIGAKEDKLLEETVMGRILLVCPRDLTSYLVDECKALGFPVLDEEPFGFRQLPSLHGAGERPAPIRLYPACSPRHDRREVADPQVVADRRAPTDSHVRSDLGVGGDDCADVEAGSLSQRAAPGDVGCRVGQAGEGEAALGHLLHEAVAAGRGETADRPMGAVESGEVVDPMDRQVGEPLPGARPIEVLDEARDAVAVHRVEDVGEGLGELRRPHHEQLSGFPGIGHVATERHPANERTAAITCSCSTSVRSTKRGRVKISPKSRSVRARPRPGRAKAGWRWFGT